MENAVKTKLNRKVIAIASLITVLLIVVLISFLNYNSQDDGRLPTTVPDISKEEKPKEDSYEDEDTDAIGLNCLQIADNYAEESVQNEFLNKDTAVDSLRDFNHELNEAFSFLEFTVQPLEVVDEYYNGESKFVVMPKSKKDLKNQIVSNDGMNMYVTPLNAIQVGATLYDYLSAYVDVGRGFVQDDFTYSIGDKIPVILGHEYKEVYDVNDDIHINYLGDNVVMNVIGFFTSGLNFSINSKVYAIDTYICSPHFNVVTPVDSSNRNFMERYYLQKNMGYVLISNDEIENNNGVKSIVDLIDYTKLLKELSNKNNVDYTILESVNEIDISN